MNKFFKQFIVMLELVTMFLLVTGCDKDKDAESESLKNANFKYAWKLVKEHDCQDYDCKKGHSITLSDMNKYEWETLNNYDYYNYVVIGNDDKLYVIGLDDTDDISKSYIDLTCYSEYDIDGSNRLKSFGTPVNCEFVINSLPKEDDVTNINNVLSNIDYSDMRVGSYDPTDYKDFEQFNLSEDAVVIPGKGDERDYFYYYKRIK